MAAHWTQSPDLDRSRPGGPSPRDLGVWAADAAEAIERSWSVTRSMDAGPALSGAMPSGVVDRLP